MIIFYRSRERNLDLEQQLRLKYGGDVLIHKSNWIASDLSNLPIKKRYSGKVLALFEPVVPLLNGAKSKRTKEFVIGNWESGKLETIECDMLPSHDEIDTKEKRWPKVLLWTQVDINTPLLEQLIGCFLLQNYAGKLQFNVYYTSQSNHELDGLGYDPGHKQLRLIKLENEEKDLNQSSPDIVIYWDTSMYYSPFFVKSVVDLYRKSPTQMGIIDEYNPEVKAHFSGFWSVETPDKKLLQVRLPKVEKTFRTFDLTVQTTNLKIKPNKLSRKEWVNKFVL